MPSTILKKITSKAEELAKLRHEIAELEEFSRQKLENLKMHRDQLQNELVTDLKKENLQSIKVSTGETYARAVRKSLQITNDIQALDWAVKNYAVSVNKIEAQKKINQLDKIPTGFEITETEYISVRKPKEKNHAETSDQE